MSDSVQDTQNEGDWGEDAMADIVATLLVVSILVAGAVIFVASA